MEVAKPKSTVSESTGALLELRRIGDITGEFYVGRYQRGYRWGKLEVEQLLNDIWTSEGAPYSLQPVVVKPRSEDEWELVDGQQRLTTLYLIFLFMQREGLQSQGPAYSIAYETRQGSELYLQELDEARSGSNIDFFHLYTAYDCIRAWFAKQGQRRQHVANKFYGFLFDSVRVIWYEAPADLDSTDLFTRLNVGRIPLTDAELFKALLLLKSRGAPPQSDRSHEIAAQWDSIERDLRRPDVWGFITDGDEEEYPTRITLLLDTIAGGTRGPARPRFYTFDALREMMDSRSPEEVWNLAVDMHALVLGWFENRDHYHKIGYLVAVGMPFGELVDLSAGKTKSCFEHTLDSLISEKLNLSPSEVMELSYETVAGRDKCERLLLLMNVETVRRVEQSAERYPFRRHADESWSLEHIHAQQAEGLTKAEQWTEWLRLHREALVDLPGLNEETRAGLIAKIDRARDQIDKDSFQRLVREITSVFSFADPSAQGLVHSVHSVTNLALLASSHNSALGNAVFEVKRRRILELDREGAYIPVCTRQVFLKYYADADAQQIHFWSAKDRESYLQAMISSESGVIYPYLKTEERQP